MRTTTTHYITLLFLSLLIIATCQAAFFFLEEGKQYCFFEDLNGDTQVLMTYKCPQLDRHFREHLHQYSKGLAHIHNLGIEAVVRDPFGNEVTRSTFGDKEGALHFKSAPELSGLYEICVKTNTSHWFGKNQKVEFHVNIEIDYEEKEQDKVESKQRVDKIQELISQLSAKLDYVAADQVYFKHREERFRETSDSTNSRVFWLGLIQLSVLLSTTIWQLWNWKRFFQRKKFI